MANNERNLPTLADLTSDVEAYAKQDKLNYLLNQPVPEKWVKKHPIIKKEILDEKGLKRRVAYEYLPIDKVEFLLRRIFKNYKIEILREGALFNAVYCTVRIHYTNIITGEWHYHDGTGAWSLQLDKGASASDLNAIKSGAVTMALPLAKTLAIKDAADMFGTLFGANLNRQDVLPVFLDKELIPDSDKLTEIKSLFESYENEISEPNRTNITRIIDEKEVSSYNKTLKFLRQLKS